MLSTVGKDDFSQLLESLRHCEGIDLEEEDGAVTATKDNSSRGCSADRGATTMVRKIIDFVEGVIFAN